MLKKPSIHFVHFTASPGGIEATLPTVVQGLPDCHFHAFVIRPIQPGQPSAYANCDIPIQYGADQNMRSYWQLWRYARRHRREVFQVFNIGPLYLLLLRLAGASRILYSIRGTIYWRTPAQRWLRKLLWRLALYRPLPFTANSVYSKERFLSQVDTRQEVKVLYNPIDPARFAPKTAPSGQLLDILYAGRLVKGKNLFLWLEVAAHIRQHFPRTRFHLYGQGPLRSALEKKAQSLGMQDCVIFHGYTSNIAQAYREADLLLFLSAYESFGNVAVESVLCGTPVLASNIPSMEEIFADYPMSLVPLDDTLFQQVIQRLQVYPQLLQATQDARASFLQRFSLQQHLQQLEQYYQRLAQKT